MAQFRPMARIISHLGERLISSSKVALLELIKNSYDAKSRFVDITINQPNKELIIYDEGHGMDDVTLRNNWLVVGTANRLEKKDDINTEDVPLGEKGLGRFSTMKLGERLVVETTTESSDYIWRLEIDWNEYGYNSKKFLDEVNNVLIKNEKNSQTRSFTRITIMGLKEFIDPKWDELKIDSFVKETANKYINPFINLPRSFDIRVSVVNFNQQKIKSKVGEIDTLLFQQAHHEIEGFYNEGKIHFAYLIRKNGEIIDSYTSAIPVDGYTSFVDSRKEGYVGEFSFHFYMFNRRRLGELKGFEGRKIITEILDRYTGGPMIFRDGFRIFPYGEAGDDWLELNKQKFRKGKTSIIGEQTAGYIALNSNKSPYLVDQTNREGLVKNNAYENFKTIIQNIFLTMLDALRKNEAKDTSVTLTQNAKKSAKEIEKIVSNLYQKGSVTLKDARIIVKNSRKIEKGFEELKRREQALIETAAIGMTSIQIAHEIHNFMQKTMSLLITLGDKVPNHLQNDISLLQINFKSLRTMISQIDEQAITIRRYKASIDLVKEIRQIAESMNLVAEKYNTHIKVKVNSEVASLKLKLNKGLIIQLFDNLILNSFYWIDSLKTSDGSKVGIVEISILADGKVTISDNGPGISKMDSDAIFEPFFSRKQDGRGLGLFISREIAAFHDIQLELLDKVNSQKRLYCFQIDFSKIVEA